MSLTRAEIGKRWRERHPEQVKANNKKYWLKHKDSHPEIGTRKNPAKDTRFKKGMKKSPNAGRPFQKNHTINNGRTPWSKGIKLSAETVAKIKAARAKQVISIETRKKMSVAHLAIREKNHFWRGGITSENNRQRNRIEYRLWREAIFARDNWTCQTCGKRGCRLNAHHKKPFAHFPELRFAIDNGETLCVACHAKTDSFRWRAKNYAVDATAS